MVFDDSDVEMGALEEQVAIPATHTGEPAAGPKVIIVIIVIIIITNIIIFIIHNYAFPVS